MKYKIKLLLAAVNTSTEANIPIDNIEVRTRMLFDTGAERNILNIPDGLAKCCGQYKGNDVEIITGFGGKILCRPFTLSKVIVDGVTIRNLEAAVVQMPNIKYGLIIGNEFMRHFNITINYMERYIELVQETNESNVFLLENSNIVFKNQEVGNGSEDE